MARHVNPELGHLPLRRIVPADIQRLCDGALEQGFAPATVHLIHAVIHKSLAQAVTWQLTPRNAADAVELPRIPKRAVTVLDRPAVQRLLATNEAEPIYPLLVLAVLGGLRRGELLGLRWADGGIRTARGVAHSLLRTASLPVSPPRPAGSGGRNRTCGQELMR